ncbi:MAG: hypothetical protein A2V72_00745 [Candidatus Nealsonbacteria bacterium RBG_13_37_56]|uniref:Uncharacterized protein n=1 Tax=Candidatus Nealsonbacteria bacterium RBG_13_37_56 TaxID=1801661 RepID=A0A1G2DXR8_9BACT|nr:MAG: hypothetical protein A2V72_00745 [Candidatus Nealsonbacteria bacterium RBG_13_37_56]
MRGGGNLMNGNPGYTDPGEDECDRKEQFPEETQSSIFGLLLIGLGYILFTPLGILFWLIAFALYIHFFS